MNENTTKIFKEIQDKIKVEQEIMEISVFSGLDKQTIAKELTRLTFFEISLIKRAFAIGEFNELRLNLNLEHIAAHFIKNGLDMYRKQVKTAEKIYYKLCAIKRPHCAGI